MIEPRSRDRLYDLLPAIYRVRDADQGYPLQALLRLIGREADVLQGDLLQLYESWFIETCPDWVVPYIGQLIGFSTAIAAGDPSNLDVSDPAARARVLSPRRDVANTIHDRRRKGTLAILESIARDAAGWPARAVEFFRHLGWTQNLNHQYPHRGGTVDLRQGRALLSVDGPFDWIAHTVDVRRPSSTLHPGCYNIPSVGLFTWRLRAYSVTRCKADNREEIAPHCYSFSVLGNDSPLFNHPRASSTPSIHSPQDLPVRITRRLLEERLPIDPQRTPPISSIASADYYGIDRSLAIWAPDWPRRGAPQPIPREQVIPADLSNWVYRTPNNYVAVDPQTGRIMFPVRRAPNAGVSVSYYYGFAADIGGGEYDRPLVETPGAIVIRIGQGRPGAAPSIQDALRTWRQMQPRPKAAVLELIDSSVYAEPLSVELDEGESLQVRAANRARPVIRLLDYQVDRPDPFSIRGRRGSSVTLDGLLIAGRPVSIQGPRQDDERSADDDLCEVIIRHCTLVPGWGLRNNCEPVRPTEPSIEMIGSRARLEIAHSIVGSLLVSASQVTDEPVEVHITDSIVDATGSDCDAPECQAISSPEGIAAHLTLTVQRCTVFGRVHVHALRLAENCIFNGLVRVARHQIGCVRFCYVPPGSRTPVRYECEPDKVSAGSSASEAALAAARVRPQYISVRYGEPDYARLSLSCADEIRRGADDQSEMGVYHNLFEPQRAALLRQRIDEFTPAGMNAGLIFVS